MRLGLLGHAPQDGQFKEYSLLVLMVVTLTHVIELQITQSQLLEMILEWLNCSGIHHQWKKLASINTLGILLMSQMSDLCQKLIIWSVLEERIKLFSNGSTTWTRKAKHNLIKQKILKLTLHLLTKMLKILLEEECLRRRKQVKGTRDLQFYLSKGKSMLPQDLNKLLMDLITQMET